jgi:hypothetical protein
MALTLPNPLILTGSGFDPGEFFAGCYADTADGPGGAGSHGYGPSEPILSWALNRSAYAIMENVEYLKNTIDTYVSGKAFVVCSVAADPAADYTGATSLQDAIDAEGSGVTIFLKNGTYTVHQQGNPANPLDINQNTVTIIGESTGAILSLVATHDLEISGSRVTLQNLTVTTAGNNHGVICTGAYPTMEHCYLHDLYLEVNGSINGVFRKMDVGGDHRSIYVHGSAWTVLFEDINCNYGQNATADPVIELNDTTQCTFNRIYFNIPTGRAQVGIEVSGTVSQLEINNGWFCSGTDVCLSLLSGAGPCIRFTDCLFQSNDGSAALTTGATKAVSFENCSFVCTLAYVGVNPFVQLQGSTTSNNGRGLLTNCDFSLEGVAPVGAVVVLKGFNGTGLTFDYVGGLYSGTSALLQLENGNLHQVKVDFVGITNEDNDQAAILVGNGTPATIDGLECYSVVGDFHSTTIVRLLGDENTGRAVLRKPWFETDATTQIWREFIQVGSFSEVDGFCWDDQPYHTVGPGIRAMISTGDLTVADDIWIHHCHITAYLNWDSFGSVIRIAPIDPTKEALTAKQIRVENCVIHVVGADPDHTLSEAIFYSDGGDDGTPGSVDSVWIENCDFHFGQLVADNGDGEIAATTVIKCFLTYKVFVVHNYIEAYPDDTVGNGGKKVIYLGSCFATNAMIDANIVKSTSGDDVTAGNVDGDRVGQFFDGATNNIWDNPLH